MGRSVATGFGATAIEKVGFLFRKAENQSSEAASEFFQFGGTGTPLVTTNEYASFRAASGVNPWFVSEHLFK